MRYNILIYCLLLAAFITGPLSAMAQVIPPTSTTTSPPTDTLMDVDILSSKRLTIQKLNDSTTLQILAGTVRLKQGTTFFDCDSCVINSYTKTFEAWGRVHINDADTANIYASHLRYLISKKIAYLDGGVRLTDGKGSLTTPDLEYDMTTDIGIYKHGGKVVNKKTVLTSQEGYYYAGLRDVYFKNKVELKDPAYYIKTDSLIYNTQSQTTRFIAQTFIRDSSGRTIETSEGYYNVATGKAEFGGRPIIKDKGLTIIGDDVKFDDSLGIAQARGNVIIRDSAQGTTIIAGEVYRDNKNDKMLATKKPLMIIKQEQDSIYITADTLFSARLTDLYGTKDSVIKDTVKGTKVVSVNTKDSTNRYFEAYRHVRIFSDSLQAVCDSVFYSFKDSVFRLYQDPIIWSKESQITGDTIWVFTKNKKADKVNVFENSFLINEAEPGVYNQVKSTRMDAYFKQGELDSVRAAGFAECIYFIQDEDSAYTGINESKCDIMDIYFAESALQKVVFRSSVTGTIWPIKQKSPDEMRLQNFRWMDDRRPKTKYELY
jgi:lipopolysaccharide assembly outer membrane protein LptD (OstA)